MLSKLAAYAEASVDEDFSVDVFESVMDHTFKTFLSESEPKIPREPKKVVDYWTTNWGRWMQQPEMLDPNSKLAKLFMLRFRMPFYLFQGWFVPQCLENKIFGESHTRVDSIPIEFKLLMCLRILGRGNCYDDLNEFSMISNSSVQRIFLQFVARFSAVFYNDLIAMPALAGLKERMDQYAALGIPGAMGSLDYESVARRKDLNHRS